jgi:hypothetical protein
MRTPRLSLALALALTLAAPALLSARKAARPTGDLDEGLLQAAYFGGDLAFREADDIDYLWVKDGFEIDGHTLQFVPWPEAALLDGEADAEDRKLARDMSGEMHRMLHDAAERAWRGKATASLDEGDVRVEGRIVGCSAGNDTAKLLVGFGAGSGNTVFDLKFVDAKSGELLAAMHTRVVSGSTWSTTDSKLSRWLDDWAEEVAKKGLAKMYAKGDDVDE